MVLSYYYLVAIFVYLIISCNCIAMFLHVFYKAINIGLELS
jgi:hypothetical protein